jgi:alpha-mannosidase
MAKFEVAAQRWADLSEARYGVSLLNDCKYGYDIRDNVLRLSLLRSPKSPDWEADMGTHRFTYSLLPHAGNTRVAVRAEAAALNVPPRVVGRTDGAGAAARLGFVARCTSQRAVIETVKPAEDGRGVILRLYEAHATRGPVEIELAPDVTRVERVGLLEEGGAPLEIVDGRIRLPLRPYEIVTLRLR